MRKHGTKALKVHSIINAILNRAAPLLIIRGQPVVALRPDDAPRTRLLVGAKVGDYANWGSE